MPSACSTLSAPSSVRDTRAVLEVDDEVDVRLEPRHDARERPVDLLRLFRRTADDQRRPRLVDEDAVHLVDDRVGVRLVAPLHGPVEVRDHVVAQVVEAELVVRAVRDVGVVGLAARDGRQVAQARIVEVHRRVVEVGRVVLEDADGDPEAVVDRAHPLRVTLGQVVVDRDQVHARAGRGAFRYSGSVATSVLPSPVFISEMLPWCRTTPPSICTSKWRMPRRRLRGLAADRERLRQDVVQRLAVGQALPELRRLRGELVVGEGLDLLFPLVHFVDERPELLQLLLVVVAEDVFQESHSVLSFCAQVREHAASMIPAQQAIWGIGALPNRDDCGRTATVWPAPSARGCEDPAA